MAAPVTSSTIQLPGACIYYEMCGTGPLLLIIPGGPQDAGVFAELAAQLADRYTVVTYDPRGNSRSTLDHPPQDQQLDLHGDDAARLIAALDHGPAYVFGTSGGAQIGFNLAARHPDRVRALLAHEPPALMLLDDPSAALAADREIYDTYRRDGVEAAMQRFMAENGLDDADGPPPEFDMPPEEAETFGRVSANFEYWLAHGLLPLSLFRPEIDTLRRGRPRIMVGIGTESAGQPIHGISLAVAEKLGSAPLDFPGDHMGFAPYPEAFAEALHRAFAGD